MNFYFKRLFPFFLFGLIFFTFQNFTTLDEVYFDPVGKVSGCIVPSEPSRWTGTHSAYATSQLYSPMDGYYYVAWVWRGDYGVETNHSLSIAKTRDFSTWYNSCGERLQSPIGLNSPTVVDPILIEQGLVNNIRLSLDHRRRLNLVYQKYDSQKRLQVFLATQSEPSQWWIRPITSWMLKNSAPIGGGSIATSGQSIGFSGLEIVNNQTSTSTTIKLYKAANDTDPLSYPSSGSYEIVTDEKPSLKAFSIDSSIQSLPTSQQLNVANPVSRSNNSYLILAKGVVRGTQWAQLWNRDKFVFARDLSGDRERTRQDLLISWRTVEANRDSQYSCDGEKTNLNPNLPGAADQCPAYFLSDLYVWRRLDSGSWVHEFVDRVWSGSEAPFDFVVRGDKQAISYYNPQRKITVKFARSNELWVNASKKILNSTVFNGWDSHNSIASHIDDSGAFHLVGNLHSYNGHNTPIEYFYAQSFVVGQIYRRDFMSDYREDRATYPYFYEIKGPNNNSETYFRYRNGYSGDGLTYTKKFDPNLKIWRDLGMLFNGSALDSSMVTMASLRAKSSSTRPFDGQLFPVQRIIKDGVSYLYFSGWVCKIHQDEPVSYAIYVNDVQRSSQSHLLLTGITDIFDPSLVTEIQGRCDSGGELHRFKRIIKEAWLPELSNPVVYLYARERGQVSLHRIESQSLPE